MQPVVGRGDEASPSTRSLAVLVVAADRHAVERAAISLQIADQVGHSAPRSDADGAFRTELFPAGRQIHAVAAETIGDESRNSTVSTCAGAANLVLVEPPR